MKQISFREPAAVAQAEGHSVVGVFAMGASGEIGVAVHLVGAPTGAALLQPYLDSFLGRLVADHTAYLHLVEHFVEVRQPLLAVGVHHLVGMGGHIGGAVLKQLGADEAAYALNGSRGA